MECTEARRLMESYNPWEVTNAELLALLIHNCKCNECHDVATRVDAITKEKEYSADQLTKVVYQLRKKYTDMLNDEEIIRNVMLEYPLLLPVIQARSLASYDFLASVISEMREVDQ